MPLTDVAEHRRRRSSAQKISQIAGVGLVTIAGGQRPAVRIQVNTRALASYGMTLETPAHGDRQRPTPTAPRARSTGRPVPTRSTPTTSCSTADDYTNQIVAYKNGAPIRLKDVATIVEAPENTQLGAYYDVARPEGAGRLAGIILNVQRQPGANVITTVDQIKKALPDADGQPAGRASRSPWSPTAPPASAPRCNDVEFELVLAVVLVVAVIFLFLRSLPATFIAGVAVPLSLVGTFGVMYLLGYSLNNLTLMALTIATGFVVDDAIVMIENISRYIEAGEQPAAGGAEGRRADRLHHHLADRLADRGADPAAVHGRRGRAAVPRVRHHAGGDHRDLGGRSR